MKDTVKQSLLGLVALGCLMAVPVTAQTADPNSTPTALSTPETATTAPAFAPLPSITSHLQLHPKSIEKLNRLYDTYAAHRLKQERSIAEWQRQLRQAQAPGSFDEREATRLLRRINEARGEMDTEFLSTRVKALKILTPVQRSQLESLARDSRIKLREDRFFQLLLLPVEEIGEVSLESDDESRQASTRRQRDRRARGYGSYGAYGGYSYGGPNYGVYGNYGQGAVGVHAGIGRYGPSVGISIGGIFGGWRLR